MTKETFDFTERTNEFLRERGTYLGRHILVLNDKTERHTEVSREINHIVFELTMRSIAKESGIEYNTQS